MDTFMKVYAEELERCLREQPGQYAWDASKLPDVLKRMRDAIASNTFSNSGLAFLATCKRLGIKNTYKAIAHFIANHV